MKKTLITTFVLILAVLSGMAQTNPVITSWLQNTTVKGRHYMAGNSIPVNDAALANVQLVRYSAGNVYISTNGIPTYITGPFLDGNPSVATAQNAIFRFPLNPTPNTGTPTPTTPGNIGLFINGVALFDYRDGVSWRSATNSLAGGPLGGNGDGVWNRDAVVAERGGFDCAKAHPAMGNYHHHQNPSAFNLDLTVISNICSTYPADGLYVIDSTKHSPLIGFAYDGYPIYGAYGYKNPDGTGGIVRMKSSYSLRNITVRNTYANGTPVTPGPPVNSTYPRGYFREDYQYNPTSPATPDYLDEHNGRFCKTPEFPNGTYCYFTTVNANWNSAYPYAVGPAFYGIKAAARVNNISETVTTYLPPAISIAASGNGICSGTNVTFTASTVNGGNNPSFQWKKNGVAAGTNSATFTDNTLTNGDVVHCVITTATGAVATSNSVIMSVTASVTPALFINTSTTAVCTGTTVVFNSAFTNGGASPAFEWRINGEPAGTEASLTLPDPADGAVITCFMTSSATCTTQPTAVSNSVQISVTPLVTPAIAIDASRTSVCAGEEIVFTATSQNGGASPAFEWRVNGEPAGTEATLTLPDPADGAVITCFMTSSAICTTQPTATSNSVQISVTPTGAPAIAIEASRTSVCAGEEIVFTATTQNGGASPAFEWRVNGEPAGTEASLTLANPADIAVITCFMTSSAICTTQPTATSNSVQISVTPLVTPAVAIEASRTSVCAGEEIVFTATPQNGGTSPAFEWRVNGEPAGTEASLTLANPADSAVITCFMTSSVICTTQPTATSDSVQISVTPLVTPAVAIEASRTSVCAGEEIVFIATPQNGGTSPAFEWRINDEPAGTETTLTLPDPADSSVITCFMTSSATCTTQPTAVSNSLQISVTPLVTPAIAIDASRTSVCAGEEIVFTATPQNGGTSPAFEWRVNGEPAGTEATMTLSDPADGAVITCFMTSSTICSTQPTATSNIISVEVIAPVTPAIFISTPVTSVTSGTVTDFTASIMNGGSNPRFQWLKNGISVGDNSTIYTDSTLANGDQIQCILTSDARCATSSQVTSNNLIMSVTMTSAVLAPQESKLTINVFPVPAYDYIAIQAGDMVREDIVVTLSDIKGVVQEQVVLYKGSTIVYFDTRRLYAGEYIVTFSDSNGSFSRRIQIAE